MIIKVILDNLSFQKLNLPIIAIPKYLLEDLSDHDDLEDFDHNHHQNLPQ